MEPGDNKAEKKNKKALATVQIKEEQDGKNQ